MDLQMLARNIVTVLNETEVAEVRFYRTMSGSWSVDMRLKPRLDDKINITITTKAL